MHVRIDAGEYTLYTENTPGDKAGWHRVIIVHVPTGYRKMDAGYPCKTEAEYRDLLKEVLTRVSAVAPRDNLDSWPASIQKRYPVMMERENVVYEAAVIALHELTI